MLRFRVQSKGAAIATAAALIFICICISSRNNVVVAVCPNVTAVPVDEAWFYKAGETGFYTVKSLGTTIQGLTQEKKPTKPLNGTKKSCWTSRPVISNIEATAGIPYMCSYEQINVQCCGLNDKMGIAKMVMGQTKIPEKVVLTIVATDSSTYFAVSACADGNTMNWAVLATKKDAKLDDKAIYKALGITEKDAEEAKKNSVHPGFTKVQKDECKMDQMLNKMADMNPIKGSPLDDGLKGFGFPL